MKIKRFSVLLLLLFWILCSCKENELSNKEWDDEVYLLEYDVQPSYSNMHGSVNRYNNVYYIMRDSWLFYYDDESQNSGKLCAKPECSHDNESCNAYVGAALGMQVYNNMIYWADVMPNLSIWRMDLSGNQRELAMEKTIDISGTKMNSQIMIHRGYVYYSEIKIDIESGQNQKIFTLSRFPLEHKEEAEVIYQREDPLLVNYTCQIDKNQMYILLDSSLETGEYERILLSCDLNNGQVKEIWEETSFYFTTTLMIKEKELHLLSTKLIEDISYQHRVYSLEEGIWEIQEEGTLPNEFSSVFLVDGSYVWRIYHDSGVMGYEIENWNHEPVFQGEAEGFITHIGKDEDGVILVVDCFLEEDNMEYIVLRVSEAGEEVLLDYTR